jgi:endonuclease/exonuclease/phosphatase family metal-dependent hydrolase
VSYEGDLEAPYTEGSGVDLVDDGSAGKDNLGISRFPNGTDTDVNNVDFIPACITPGFANSSLAADCQAGGPALEIHDIQGAGATSPFDGQGVSTPANIVTAVGPEGFFIQTPADRMDGDPQTSNGIYVFTDAAPAVAVGDIVDVSGGVTEFFEFTEFTAGSVVTVISSGNPLPPAIALDALTPSSDPASPSCAAGALECFEGMLVSVANGAVTSGNQVFGGDPLAEVYFSAAGSRTYREPGIEYPGVGGLIPTWDGNPEVFELDADKLGLPSVPIAGGSSFTATGVIGFEFGGYELWPTSLDINQAVMPVPVRDRNAGETTVGSYNLYRFATEGEYAVRLAKHSRYIREVLLSPDILGVQEAESITALQDLADTIAQHDPGVVYQPYLLEGNDVGGIDVGFLVSENVTVDQLTQLGKDEIFSYDDSLLHDRPPLLLEGRYTGNGEDFPLAVMVVHNRSLNDVETERVQLKRLAQAESIAQMVQDFQTAQPAIPLAVVGDFNAYEFTDGYVDAVGHIKGDFDPAASLRSGSDLVDPNLTNQVDLLPAADRYSYVFEGNAQALDHALTSQSAAYWVRGMAYGRGNADAPELFLEDGSTALAASDHDGLVLYLMTDYDGDGVSDDIDGCPENDRLTEWRPDTGCSVAIPTLDPVGMLLLWLLLGGLAGFTIYTRRFVKP